MGNMTFVLVGLQALACYVDWVIGFGGIAADFEACLDSWRDAMSTENLWDCISAYGDQLTALTNDYFGCFN